MALSSNGAGDRGRKKTRKGIQEMLKYLSLQGKLNQEPSKDEAQAEKGQSQPSSVLQPQAGGSTGLLMDLAANEKAVHADFFNDFEDLFDDDDVQ
ncbi:rCG55620, isoform CRA_e [Rattus norvegicus]|uniref:COP9 signalosome complex subunit 9 n=2 Tax=Rattus norvegicus TaxID=10116 RepID=F7F834_RAT|nr:rCG55620, isoform CRA_e [Rattus norvegicus]